ncbi:MAG: hypothetical protein R6W72_06900, partial [Desulfurivibrionaceae bacterium]
MLPEWLILLISLLYLGVLFAIASYGDRRADAGRSIISNPYIYTLSIAVYCTAWTYYGSVGRAATTGIGFLPIYLGPTLMAALWWLVLGKIIRIAKVQRITSIADFIASRYGKSALAGGLVTVIAMVGTVPYISLQLKAISRTFTFMHFYPELEELQRQPLNIWNDTAFAVAVILAAFSILFGTRHIDATERHEGMVAAIAFESVVKLLAFSAAGIYITFFLFNGPGDLFGRMAEVPELGDLMTFGALPGGYVNWFTLTFLSMSAIMFLPRQFQVGWTGYQPRCCSDCVSPSSAVFWLSSSSRYDLAQHDRLGGPRGAGHIVGGSSHRGPRQDRKGNRFSGIDVDPEVIRRANLNGLQFPLQHPHQSSVVGAPAAE